MFGDRNIAVLSTSGDVAKAFRHSDCTHWRNYGLSITNCQELTCSMHYSALGATVFQNNNIRQCNIMSADDKLDTVFYHVYDSRAKKAAYLCKE